MKETLNYLFENNTLSKKEAKSILLEIGQGKHNNSQNYLLHESYPHRRNQRV